MSVTCGFFNGANHDRKYNAAQMSSLFDGIINDGVFMNIGTAMVVKENAGLMVNVGIGRAWFNSTWTYIDAVEPITADAADVVLDRWDALVLEVDQSVAVRNNTLKFVKGTPKSSEPVKPTMEDSEFVHQHPLCYIYRKAGSTAIAQADITNCVGTTEFPFVSGILSTVKTDELIVQWQDEFKKWMESEQTSFDAWALTQKEWFNEWFANLQDQLDTEQAAHLQNQIDKINFKIADVYVAILASNWVEKDGRYINEVKVDGITDADSPVIGLHCTGTNPTDEEMVAYFQIDDVVSSTDKITFYADTKPVSNLKIILKSTNGTGESVIANFDEVVDRVTALETQMITIKSNTKIIKEYENRNTTLDNMSATGSADLIPYVVTEAGLYTVNANLFGYAGTNGRLMIRVTKNNISFNSEFNGAGYYGIEASQIFDCKVGDKISGGFFSSVAQTSPNNYLTCQIVRLK